MRICAINEIEQEHLNEVISEMKIMGEPTTRAYYTGEQYIAIEGSHRLAACNLLGMTPNIIEINEDTEIMEHDVEDLPTPATGRDFMEYLGNTTPWYYDFN